MSVYTQPKGLNLKLKSLSIVALLSSFVCFGNESNKPAPEILDLYTKNPFNFIERIIPDLENGFVDSTPIDRKDGIPVGELGVDGGDKNMIFKFAQENKDLYDSMLISYKGKLIFESYYLRGRINLPHEQQSATKSYTSIALGRAIQLGYLTMADLDKPVASFLKDLNLKRLVEGASNITLHQAMTMSSGIRISKNKRKELLKNPAQLKGQGRVQSYLEHSAPISAKSQTFYYSNFDSSMVMQVLDAVVPGTVENFIKNEVFDKLGISVYGWRLDISGLPIAGYGSSMTSRDMLKWGTLVINNGEWNGKQLISKAFIAKATSKIVKNPNTDWLPDGLDFTYGYFWWQTEMKVGDKTYICKFAWGGLGQLIFVLEELDLTVVVTAHDGAIEDKFLLLMPEKILPAFVK